MHWRLAMYGGQHWWCLNVKLESQLSNFYVPIPLEFSIASWSHKFHKMAFWSSFFWLIHHQKNFVSRWSVKNCRSVCNIIPLIFWFLSFIFFILLTPTHPKSLSLTCDDNNVDVSPSIVLLWWQYQISSSQCSSVYSSISNGLISYMTSFYIQLKDIEALYNMFY